MADIDQLFYNADLDENFYNETGTLYRQYDIVTKKEYYVDENGNPVDVSKVEKSKLDKVLDYTEKGLALGEKGASLWDKFKGGTSVSSGGSEFDVTGDTGDKNPNLKWWLIGGGAVLVISVIILYVIKKRG